MNKKDQRQLDILRRGRADAVEHLAASQEAINESLALLQRSDRMEAGQKSEKRRSIPKDTARIAPPERKRARAVPARGKSAK